MWINIKLYRQASQGIWIDLRIKIEIVCIFLYLWQEYLDDNDFVGPQQFIDKIWTNIKDIYVPDTGDEPETTTAEPPAQVTGVLYLYTLYSTPTIVLI